VFFSLADECEFLCANIVSSSKKRLGIGVISNLRDSNEMRDKPFDSDKREFLDTDVSSTTDFGAQEYDTLLLDVGDKSGVGGNPYVTNFLWEDMDNYVR
jgi:hypothetical protein